MPPTANQERDGGEWRSTTPGSNIVEEISMTQPIVRSGPTTSAIVVDGHAVLHAGHQPVRLQVRLDQLAGPAGVVGLHQQQHDVEPLAQGRDLAQV